MNNKFSLEDLCNIIKLHKKYSNNELSKFINKPELINDNGKQSKLD